MKISSHAATKTTNLQATVSYAKKIDIQSYFSYTSHIPKEVLIKSRTNLAV
jgi:hypothetical protein